MPTLLRIDSSSRVQGSHSRALADHFQEQWQARHAGAKVAVRDLVKSPVPHIAAATIAAIQTPPDEQTDATRTTKAFSDELIAELLAADVLLISTPIYNFSVPSALKAYIDHVVCINRTFAYDPATGFRGLVKGKVGFVAASYGAAGYAGGPLTTLNFLEPYLRTLWGFLGVTDLTFFSVEGTTTDPAALAASRDRAYAEIGKAVSRDLAYTEAAHAGAVPAAAK